MIESYSTGRMYHIFIQPSIKGHQLFLCLFVLRLFIFRQRGRDGEREGEKHQCVVAFHVPLLGTCPATQACTLTGNWTCDPLVRRLAVNPLSHTSQGCFHVLTTMNNAAMHLGVGICIFVNKCFQYFWVDIQKKVAGSYGNSIQFLRNCHIVFHSGSTSLHSHQQWMRAPFSPQLFQLLVFTCLVDNCHFDRCVVVSCCSFDLHFKRKKLYPACYQSCVTFRTLNIVQVPAYKHLSDAYIQEIGSLLGYFWNYNNVTKLNRIRI